jgi:hypothetical protein
MATARSSPSAGPYRASALVCAFNKLRYFERDAVRARQVRDGGEFLAAAIQPGRGEVIAVEQGAQIMVDEAGGCGAARHRVLERFQVDSLWVSQEQRLGCGEGLAEPQQVDQVLGRVPAPGPPM